MYCAMHACTTVDYSYETHYSKGKKPQRRGESPIELSAASLIMTAPPDPVQFLIELAIETSLIARARAS